MNTRKSVRYVCRFCAAGGATEASDAPLFHNCHVCKAPNAMIPVGMHDQLIKLLATVETLYAQRDQALKATKGAKKFHISNRPRSTLMNLERVITLLSDQHVFVEGWKGLQKPGDSEDAVNPKTGETVHFRTWLNRLIDRCPEAVQNHVWDLREQADPEEERYTREDMQEAFRSGHILGARCVKNRVRDAVRTPVTSKTHRESLETDMSRFFKDFKVWKEGHRDD